MARTTLKMVFFKILLMIMRIIMMIMVMIIMMAMMGIMIRKRRNRKITMVKS